MDVDSKDTLGSWVNISPSGASTAEIIVQEAEKPENRTDSEGKLIPCEIPEILIDMECYFCHHAVRWFLGPPPSISLGCTDCGRVHGFTNDRTAHGSCYLTIETMSNLDDSERDIAEMTFRELSEPQINTGEPKTEKRMSFPSWTLLISV